MDRELLQRLLSEAYRSLDMVEKLVNMSIDDFLSDFRNIFILRFKYNGDLINLAYYPLNSFLGISLFFSP